MQSEKNSIYFKCKDLAGNIASYNFSFSAHPRPLCYPEYFFDNTEGEGDLPALVHKWKYNSC